MPNKAQDWVLQHCGSPLDVCLVVVLYFQLWWLGASHEIDTLQERRNESFGNELQEADTLRLCLRVTVQNCRLQPNPLCSGSLVEEACRALPPLLIQQRSCTRSAMTPIPFMTK